MSKIFTKLNLGDAVASSGGRVWKKLSAESAEEPDTNYLTFSSPNNFTIATRNSNKTWDGTIEYSTDANTWKTWNGVSTLSSANGFLYLRGIGNTKITGKENTDYGFLISGAEISCMGNIENLLDYEVVANGAHPIMASYCFYLLFAKCTGLISAPELPAMTLTSSCYERIFSGCTSLRIAPKLPAMTMVFKCYYLMFSGCTSLISAPPLPATTIASDCYFGMFSGCTKLENLPRLPATTLGSNCYFNMFKDCTSIKLSTLRAGEYQTVYRIPTIGTGKTATNALLSMFDGTGGTFAGTPEINTEYYTSNTLV